MRTPVTTAALPAPFARALADEMRAIGVALPADATSDEVMAAARDCVQTDDARYTHRMLDPAFVRVLDTDPEAAFIGAAHASAPLPHAAVSPGLARTSLSHPEAVARTRQLAPVWDALAPLGSAPLPLWNIATRGYAPVMYVRYASDGLADARYACQLVRVGGIWTDAGTSFPRSRLGEWVLLQRAIAGLCAEPPPASGWTQLCLVVQFDDTLLRLLRLAGDAAAFLVSPTLRDGQDATDVAVVAPLLVDGRRVHVVALITGRAGYRSDPKEWGLRWVSQHGLGALIVAPPPCPPVSGVREGLDIGPITPRTLRRHRLGARPCAHEDASWSLNRSETAAVLSCAACGNARIALVWRDACPPEHEWHVAAGTDAHVRLCAVRDALSTLGPIEPAQAPLRGLADMDPARWARVAHTPHGSGAEKVPEVVLAGRRRR